MLANPKKGKTIDLDSYSMSIRSASAEDDMLDNIAQCIKFIEGIKVSLEVDPQIATKRAKFD